MVTTNQNITNSACIDGSNLQEFALNCRILRGSMEPKGKKK
jgi:hypothetical protein